MKSYAIYDHLRQIDGRMENLREFDKSNSRIWWKGLDCPKNFPFARDRVAERDISAANELPPYMRHCYKALFDVYEEIEELAIQRETKIFGVDYAKTSMKELARAYMEEAKWFHSGYVPAVEKYLRVALVTSGFLMLSMHSLVGMGEIATKEALDWAANEPLLVRAASIICRLTDDMAGHEFEQKRGHVASAVECYVKENGAPKQEAYVEFQKMVTNGWKDMNKECLQPIAIPKSLLEGIVNLARVIHLLYQDKDNYTHSNTKLKNLITFFLVDPMRI
ncbi:hypothetical protein M9H77_25476 [Catharanthus roseus]|uniref:Uncharacterized protein n=1 Tax=Catharanthus roseus TaxID=4058 RepID=A0ACC0A703_CATRO|nr:hypothetical protein M9H77_25476 [Catharanthus roseus]